MPPIVPALSTLAATAIGVALGAGALTAFFFAATRPAPAPAPRFLRAARRDSVLIAATASAALLVTVFVVLCMSSDLGPSGSATPCCHPSETPGCEGCAKPCGITTNIGALGCIVVGVGLSAAAAAAVVAWRRLTEPDAVPGSVTHPTRPAVTTATPAEAKAPAGCPCASNPKKKCDFGGVVSSTVAISSTAGVAAGVA